MKAKLFFGIILAMTALGSAVSGQSKSKPTIPFVDKGACPFECCTYREWTVDKATAVRSAMRDSSPIAFRLKQGERVKGVTGVVVTSRPGEVRVLKRTKIGRFTANKGDTLYLLTYIGEGFHKVWYRGNMTEEETYDPAKFREISQPISEWWVKVRNSRGQIGWSREPDNFGNKDQCGN
ncbi:MAG: hypothetical protein K1X36_00715 [Pyrinomonadaceae bacterium]|nr:hypothetical protein [Pyrinomonadaceae bacterium]